MCTIEGCSNEKIMARSMCNAHYKKWWRYGDAETPHKIHKGLSLKEHFEVVGWTVTPGGCWEWKGTRVEAGYGQLSHEGKRLIASRVAFKIYQRELLSGEHVLHTCDNPPCVNPTHLYAGTNISNIQDRVAKGRSWEGTGKPKLDEAMAHHVYYDRVISKEPLKTVAARYKISSQTVWSIATGRTWKEVYAHYHAI